MRIIRKSIKRSKLKRRGNDERKAKLDSIRSRVQIFESNGLIIAYLPREPGIHQHKQCIVLEPGRIRYTGIDIDSLKKKRMKLEDLSVDMQKYLIRELK